jgi:hypothetical protein
MQDPIFLLMYYGIKKKKECMSFGLRIKELLIPNFWKRLKNERTISFYYFKKTFKHQKFSWKNW